MSMDSQKRMQNRMYRVYGVQRLRISYTRQRTFAIRISIRKLGFRKKPLPITQSLSQSGPRWRTDGRCRIIARVGQI